jgi:hypothetical protein
MHLDLIRWRKGMIRQPFDPLMGQGLGAPRPWGSRSKSPPKVGRAVSPSDEIVHQLSDHLCCRQITPDRNRAVQSRITTCLRQKSTKNLNAAWGKGKGEPKVNCPARWFSAPFAAHFSRWRAGDREGPSANWSRLPHHPVGPGPSRASRLRRLVSFGRDPHGSRSDSRGYLPPTVDVLMWRGSLYRRRARAS